MKINASREPYFLKFCSKISINDVFSAGIEIYTIWNTPIDQRERAILQSGGRFGGGILGGAASGAVLGSYGFNAVTVAIGAFLGAVAGSETGEWIIKKICK